MSYGLRVMACLVVWLLPLGSAWGFGAAGHRVTGAIAEALLTPATRAGLSELLGGVDLAALSVAADEQRDALRAELPDSPRWHYDDRLVCHPDLSPDDYCRGGACASAAIARLNGVLADARAPRAERARAVLLLVHSVGDIHQPLHAADNNDRGGNSTRVRLDENASTRSLHQVWDVDFVQRALAGRSPREAADAWRAQYARELSGYALADAKAWMAESYGVAREFAYGGLPGFACDTPPRAPVVLPAAYVERATRLMPLLLTKAGVRIASVLNAALDPRR